MGTAWMFCGWALGDTLRLGTAGILCCWALQEYLVGRHCKALKGYSAVGHCRDTWWLGTSGILCGWALHGYSAVGHCRNTLSLSTAGRLRAEGENNIDFKI